MRYRSKANPRVTIEAMRLPAIDEEVSAELDNWLSTLPCEILSGRDGSIDYSNETDDCWVNADANEWLLLNANGFVSHATHEEFEAAWEPAE